jgi:hypothetical protein
MSTELSSVVGTQEEEEAVAVTVGARNSHEQKAHHIIPTGDDEDDDDDGRVDGDLKDAGDDENDDDAGVTSGVNDDDNGVIQIIGPDGDPVYRKLPQEIANKFPPSPCPIGDFIRQDLSAEQLAPLYLPITVLAAPWAPKRLSIVGRYDKTSYCFTNSYGRLFDRSSGSCYYENAEGPLADAAYSIDRANLPTYQGRIRKFHPDELLTLSGFPDGFIWPSASSTSSGKEMLLKRKFACVGNSINVKVVRAVMEVLFTTDCWSS